MEKNYFVVELPNGYILGYFNTYKEAIQFVTKNDNLGIYDLQIRENTYTLVKN